MKVKQTLSRRSRLLGAEYFTSAVTARKHSYAFKYRSLSVPNFRANVRYWTKRTCRCTAHVRF